MDNKLIKSSSLKKSFVLIKYSYSDHRPYSTKPMNFRYIEWIIDFKSLNYLFGLHINYSSNATNQTRSVKFNIMARSCDRYHSSKDTITQHMHIILILYLTILYFYFINKYILKLINHPNQKSS